MVLGGPRAEACSRAAFRKVRGDAYGRQWRDELFARGVLDREAALIVISKASSVWGSLGGIPAVDERHFLLVSKSAFFAESHVSSLLGRTAARPECTATAPEDDGRRYARMQVEQRGYHPSPSLYGGLPAQTAEGPTTRRYAALPLVLPGCQIHATALLPCKQLSL